MGFSIARVFFQKKDYDLAFTKSMEILRASPFFWDAWLLLISSIRDNNQVNC